LAKFGRVNLMAFASVLFAGILLGFVAHEAFHVLTISEPSKLTIYFGANDFSASVCCLDGDANALEAFAYGLQFLTMLGWIYLNRKLMFS